MRRVLPLLRTPRWLSGLIVALVAVAGFVRLGFWQLDRLEEKRALVALTTERLAAPPVPLAGLSGLPAGELEYRRVSAVGVFDPSREVVIQARTRRGRSGQEVVTPLRLADGTLLAVDRGWIPIDMAGPPVVDAPPPPGTVEVVGVLRRGETWGPLGAPEEGPIRRLGRIDLPTLTAAWDGDVFPLYLAVTGDASPGELPSPLPLPSFDEGPHLGYAVQWFAFGLVVAVGFPLLLVRTSRRSRSEREADEPSQRHRQERPRPEAPRPRAPEA